MSRPGMRAVQLEKTKNALAVKMAIMAAMISLALEWNSHHNMWQPEPGFIFAV